MAALAGCLGRGADRAPATSGSSAAVRGLVADEEGRPLGGALVRVLLQNRSAAADASGAYALSDLPPGPARLVASAQGHASQTRDVLLDAGVAFVVDFRLRALALPAPFHRTLPVMSGQITCGLPLGTGCDVAGVGTGTTHRFDVETGLAGVVAELAWEPSAAQLPAQLKLEVRAATPTACGAPFQNATGPSPVRLRVLDGFPLHGGHECLRVALPADAAAVNQAYTVHVTVFYHAPPAPDFTALP